MKLPVRVKIELTDDNWSWVFTHHQEAPELILEDDVNFIVEYSSRVEYERHVERWCEMVKCKELNQENMEL